MARLRADDKPVYGLCTYGQPRTGDREFADRFNADFKPRCFRFVNKEDVVTRVPMRAMSYSHVGNFLYFDAEGKLSDDLAFWYRFIDAAKAAIEDLLHLQADALADHSMTNGYLPKLAMNAAFDPFAAAR